MKCAMSFRRRFADCKNCPVWARLDFSRKPKKRSRVKDNMPIGREGCLAYKSDIVPDSTALWSEILDCLIQTAPRIQTSSNNGRRTLRQQFGGQSSSTPFTSVGREQLLLPASLRLKQTRDPDRYHTYDFVRLCAIRQLSIRPRNTFTCEGTQSPFRIEVTWAA